MPPLRVGLVARPRLVSRLDQGLDSGRRLILVSAPAGYGKTTLLAEWVMRLRQRRQDPVRVAWLSLDRADNDVARFFSYLTAALGALGSGTPASSPRVPSNLHLSGADLDGIAHQINTISAALQACVLVLDDYQQIVEDGVHELVAYVLEHQPSAMRLAIATRADPPLPVARLRARRQLVELRQADLRFTADEAKSFISQVADLKLSARDIAGLSARTEGWVAGLQMASLAIKFGADGGSRLDASAFIRDFAGSHRYIMDYLMEEVLDRQSRRIQDFLVQTAILDELCATLCSAVVREAEPTVTTGRARRTPVTSAEAQEILELLERTNLFTVPLDDRREWYRYHRLFADLLRERLRRTCPHLAQTLHARASVWYEVSGAVDRAIGHALGSQDHERAAELMERAAEDTLMRGEVATYLRWVDALPEEAKRTRPLLRILQAWAMVLSGRPMEAIEKQLREAQGASEAEPGAVAAVRALLCAIQGDVARAGALARQALDQLPSEDRLLRGFADWIVSAVQLAVAGPGADESMLSDALEESRGTGNLLLSVIILCNQAEILLRRGRLQAASETYQRAAKLATDESGGLLPVAGQALIGLGDVAREWNDLDSAQRCLTEGIRLTSRWSDIGSMEGHVALARTKMALGDASAAQEELSRAWELARRYDLTELDDRAVAMVEARTRYTTGDLHWVHGWAEEIGLFRYLSEPLEEAQSASYVHRLRKYELPVFARFLIGSGQASDAIAILEPLVPIAERRDRPGLLIEIHLLLAMAYGQVGRADHASSALARALSLGREGGFVRVFLDEGAPVAEMLGGAKDLGDEALAGYAERLLAEFENDEARTWRPVADAAQTPSPRPGKQDVLALEHLTTPSERLVEPLTERELEILRYLDTHLSSREIASVLSVSVNTVRFHIKSIYGKLGVHRRADAVGRAAELHLL